MLNMKSSFWTCRHGTKADIYSFGVTLLEMARGKVPFAGMPLEVVAMNKLHHPSPSLPASYEGRTFSTVSLLLKSATPSALARCLT